jgi:hypothetical protein
MAQNPSEPYPVDPEAWQIAFRPYGANPSAALDLARDLIAIKQLLQAQPPDVRAAIAALDDAADALFPLTEFHRAGYDLYRTLLERGATTAHEALMDSLGIKF